MVRRAHERFNRVHLFTLSSEGVSVKLRVNDKLTTRRADWYRKMLQELHPSLPPGLNVTLPINMFDEPLSWVTPLPSFDEAALHNGTLTLKEAWFKHACDAVGLSQYRTLHGAFLDPPAMEFDHELLPILSPYTLPGCFAGGALGWIPAVGACHALGLCIPVVITCCGSRQRAWCGRWVAGDAGLPCCQTGIAPALSRKLSARLTWRTIAYCRYSNSPYWKLPRGLGHGPRMPI